MRAVKWCPELGVASLRSKLGKIATMSEGDWERAFENDDDTKRFIRAIIAIAKERPNEWMSY